MRLPSGEPGDVDDAAPFPLAHVRNGVADAAGRRGEFLLEQIRQLPVAHLEEVLRDDGRRRVHQNVDPAVALDHLRGHRRDASVVGEVGRDAEHTVGVKSAQVADGGGVDLGVLADEDDASAFGQKLLGAGLADAAAAAGNDGNFVLEPKIQVFLLTGARNDDLFGKFRPHDMHDAGAPAPSQGRGWVRPGHSCSAGSHAERFGKEKSPSAGRKGSSVMTRSFAGTDRAARLAWRPRTSHVVHRTRRIFPQLFSEAQMPRSSRKRSTGAEEWIARMRHRPTPVHWKPHFSSTWRDAGLVTRADE